MQTERPELETLPQDHASPSPTVLRWMGSKRRLSDKITSAIGVGTSERTYYEPFLGSGAVFFALRPARAVLADTNRELMDTWRVMAEFPEKLWSQVQEMVIDHETYYRIRSEQWPENEVLKRAVRFIYLNRYCFNGIYRTNRQNEFNVPMGSATGALPSLAAFRACGEALRFAALECGDFEQTLKSAEAGDVAYLDPPYQSVRSTYGEYGYNDFDQIDVSRLSTCVADLTKRDVAVFLSLPSVVANSHLFDDLYSTSHSLRYTVASASSRRHQSTESLLMNEVAKDCDATQSQVAL